jgi:ABC-type polysaccharide/polyol phosphate transport system ATPase subunit
MNDRIATLPELGSGFHPDLTGAENLRVNAVLIGFSGRRTYYGSSMSSPRPKNTRFRR